MEVFAAIQTMLAVRDYRTDPIPDDVVHRIVEAGRLTGSSRNRQEWDFVVVRQAESLRRLGELASTGPYIANAQLAILVVVPDGPVGYIDGARAAQDMMLTAWEAGIGSNWVGNVNSTQVKTLFNIPAERLVLVAIPFGYPAKRVGLGRKQRKALPQVAHSERFGQPMTG
ncbi:MAG TPA: nitroreductase family protein [Caldilineaceae bacterium]|nr:nitroreductase family protein [Caldilineaceae bacterium]